MLRKISYLFSAILATLMCMLVICCSTKAASTPNQALQSETIPVKKTDQDVYQTRTVTETINFIDENGQKIYPSRVSTIKFQRVDITNKQGEVVNPGGDWSPKQANFATVEVPNISGYQTNKKIVASHNVNPDDPNIEINISYQPIANHYPAAYKLGNNERKKPLNQTSYIEPKKNVATIKPQATLPVTHKQTMLPETGLKATNSLVNIMGIMLILIGFTAIKKIKFEKI